MQRTYVDPEAAHFEDFVECCHVVEHVVRRVDEEASDNAVPFLCLLSKDIDELSGGHREVILIRISHFKAGACVRQLHLAESISIALQVVKVMDPRVQSELVHSLRLIEDEV